MIRSLYKQLRHQASIESFAILMSLTVAISLIIGIGQWIQYVGYSVISGNYGNIHDSISSGCGCELVNTTAWIQALLWPPFIIASAGIAITSLKFRTPRNQSAYLLLLSFLFLTIADITTTILEKDILWSDFPASLIANSMGSILISLYVSFLWLIIDMVQSSLHDSKAIKLLIACSAPILTSSAATIFSFFFLTFTLNLVPIDARLVFSGNTSGVYTPSNQEKLSLMADSYISEGILDIESLSGPTLTVQPDKNGARFGVASITDCTIDQAQKLLEKDSFHLQEISEALIATINTDVTWLRSTLSSDHIRLEQRDSPEGVQIWTSGSQGTDHKKHNISTLLNNNSAIHVISNNSDITLFMVGPAINFRKTPIPNYQRIIAEVTNGGTANEISFSERSDFQYEDKPECQITYLKKNKHGLIYKELEAPALYAGLAIHIKNNRQGDGNPFSSNISYGIENEKGLLHLKNLGNQDLKRALNGEKIEAVAIRGIAEQFSVNSVLRSTSNEDVFYITEGGISASFSQDGKLIVDGVRSYIRQNNIRINQTGWETTDWGGKGILLAFIFSALAWMTKAVLGRLKTNETYRIIS